MPKINKPVTCNIKKENGSILKWKDWYYSLISIIYDLKDFRKWLVEIAFLILSSIEFHVVGPEVLIILSANFFLFLVWSTLAVFLNFIFQSTNVQLYKTQGRE